MFYNFNSQCNRPINTGRLILSDIPNCNPLFLQRFNHWSVQRLRLWHLPEEESGPVQLQGQHGEPGPAGVLAAPPWSSAPPPSGPPQPQQLPPHLLFLPPALLRQVRTSSSTYHHHKQCRHNTVRARSVQGRVLWRSIRWTTLVGKILNTFSEIYIYFFIF